MVNRLIRAAMAMCLAGAAMLVAAVPASAATGSWTITLFCKDTGEKFENYLRVSFTFSDLPGFSGAVAGRHDYGAGPNDYVQTSSGVSVVAGHAEHSYEVDADHLSFGSYAPASGDAFAWRVVIDGHGIVLTGSAFVSGAGCSAPAIVPATPTISGLPKVGRALVSSTGTWSPTGLTFTRQWYANGSAIAGATKVGNKLTAKPGTWGPGTVAKSYRWYANGKAIKGAKSKTLKLKQAQVGKRITVRATGTKLGYVKAARVSKPTKKVGR